tara:strand:- start:2509 stop:2898 length:390 start_codon:yes stop_codon:yes gene_type:complete
MLFKKFSIPETSTPVKVVCGLVLLAIIYYFFFNTKSEQAGGNNIIIIYLFKADWCPHCQNFMSTWTKMKQKYGNKVQFKTLDSDKDKSEMRQHKIEGFPTIKNSNGNEYTGNRSEIDFDKWINTQCIHK